MRGGQGAYSKLVDGTPINLDKMTLIGLPGVLPTDKMYDPQKPLPDNLNDFILDINKFAGCETFSKSLFFNQNPVKSITRYSTIMKNFLVGADTTQAAMLSDNMRIYHYVVENPSDAIEDLQKNNNHSDYYGHDAQCLATRIFAPNLTKGGRFEIENGRLLGEALSFEEVKERLGNLRLFANSMGTSQAPYTTVALT